MSTHTRSVLVENKPGVLARIDRLLVMRDGAIQLDGPREEVLEKMRAAAGRPASSQPPSQGQGQTSASQAQLQNQLLQQNHNADSAKTK